MPFNLPRRPFGQRIWPLVRDEIGPVASFKDVTVVPRLPKTRSGKILRSTKRAIADGAGHETPSTIDDPAILEGIAAAVSRPGRAASS